MKLWLKIGKLCHFISELIRDYQIFKKGLIFVTAAVLQIGDELILAENESRPPYLRKVMGHTVDSVTLMGRTQGQISAEGEELLKPALSENIRTLYNKET